MKKKIIAVLVAVVLAVTCAVSANAVDSIIGNGSGQLTPFFADFDPSALTEMVAGLDFGGILNDLGMGDLGGLLGGVDLGGLLGGLGGLGDMLGGFNLEDLLGGILGGDKGNSGGNDPTTAAPTTAAPTTAAPTTGNNNGGSTTTAPTTAKNNDIPKTGDAGITAVVGLAVAAGAAFVLTRKKSADAE